MPFDLHQAAARLRQLHGNALAFRAALLDVAFAAGCPVSEQAVALEHGDAVTLRMASPHATGGEKPAFAVLDLDAPGGPGTWPAEFDSLGGPALAQTWALALHTLMHTARDQPWELVYTRGPALGVPAYVRERLAQTASTVQLAAIASRPSHTAPLDGVALTVRRSANVWRLPACDWTAAVAMQGDDALERLVAWLRTLPGSWTLHQLALRSQHDLTAILRADRSPLPLPAMTLRELPEPPRLTFPVNDVLLAWPREWLPRPLAVRTQADGLWLAGLTPRIADDVVLPEQIGALTLEWQVEAVARDAAAQARIAVSLAEARGPVAAGLDGPIWRLPGVDELDLAQRGLTARLAEAFRAQRG